MPENIELSIQSSFANPQMNSAIPMKDVIVAEAMQRASVILSHVLERTRLDTRKYIRISPAETKASLTPLCPPGVMPDKAMTIQKKKTKFKLKFLYQMMIWEK